MNLPNINVRSKYLKGGLRVETEQVLREISKLTYRDIAGDDVRPEIIIKDNEIFAGYVKYIFDPYENTWKKYTKGWTEVKN